MNTKADPNVTTNAAEPGKGPAGAASSPTTEHVADVAHEAVDRVADNAARAEERLRERAAAGERQVKEKAAEARQTTERAVDQVRQYTQENPLAAAAIAFAAGLVVARMLGR